MKKKLLVSIIVVALLSLLNGNKLFSFREKQSQNSGSKSVELRKNQGSPFSIPKYYYLYSSVEQQITVNLIDVTI